MTSLSQVVARAERNAGNIEDAVKELLALLTGATYLDRNVIAGKAESITTLNI